MQNISIGNGNFLNVQIDGNKELPKVILSNSLGADTRMWNAQVETLKNKFCVIRYDKRGHGKSSPVEGPYSFEILENDVITILDELEIEKAHFVGLSIGGMTSLGLALKHQKRFNKLICCAARADMPPPMKETWDQRINIVKDKGTDGVVDGSIERWYSDDFNKNSSNADIINLSKNMISNTSTNGYIGCCEAIKNLDYLKELSTISKEMLFISGENDMGAPAMAMEEMSHLTPNSKYVCVPGASHILNIEASDLVNETILNFLN